MTKTVNPSCPCCGSSDISHMIFGETPETAEIRYTCMDCDCDWNESQRNRALVAEWIPCSERLPEDLEAVLVYSPNHYPNEDIITAYMFKGEWFSNVAAAKTVDYITHWRKLPAPPQGGE